MENTKQLVKNILQYCTLLKKDTNFIEKHQLNVIYGEFYLDFKDYLTKLYEKYGLKQIKNYLIINPLLIITKC